MNSSSSSTAAPSSERLHLWDDCLRIFRDNLSPEQYKAWFEPISCVSCSDSELILRIPSPFFMEQLEAQYPYIALREKTVQTSKLDGTKKYLFALADGNYVESVWMQYHHGNSVCISSQVGCRMGCRFCASTLGGLERNLTPSEMLDQIYAIARDTKERVSNVVVMGTGEPLDNYDNLLRFLQIGFSPLMCYK